MYGLCRCYSGEWVTWDENLGMLIPKCKNPTQGPWKLPGVEPSTPTPTESPNKEVKYVIQVQNMCCICEEIYKYYE